VEFRLIYEGHLPAAGSSKNRAKEKQAIRRFLHPQLRALWEKHPALQGTRENLHAVNNRLLPKYEFGGFKFLPIVNDYFHLICSLDILFLRREGPGDAVHGGDLDNRLKVLLDGLRRPSSPDELKGEAPTADETPFFCLLSDDSLVSQFQVTTDRLLMPMRNDQGANDVLLVIKVVTSSLRPGEVGKIP